MNGNSHPTYSSLCPAPLRWLHCRPDMHVVGLTDGFTTLEDSRFYSSDFAEGFKRAVQLEGQYLHAVGPSGTVGFWSAVHRCDLPAHFDCRQPQDWWGAFGIFALRGTCTYNDCVPGSIVSPAHLSFYGAPPPSCCWHDPRCRRNTSQRLAQADPRAGTHPTPHPSASERMVLTHACTHVWMFRRRWPAPGRTSSTSVSASTVSAVVASPKLPACRVAGSVACSHAAPWGAIASPRHPLAHRL